MDRQQHRDEWLMAELAEGRRDALELLIRRHATPLLSFIQRMVGDRQRSEDLFQDVFCAVWTKRGQYQYGRPFRPWLYAIALNACRADFRRPALTLASEESGAAVPAPGLSPAEAAVATETAALVAQAVTLLPSQQRAVVVLRIWQQLGYREIADILDCTETTVRSHMHHGLRALRKYLEPRL
jgi:RNA polymerase sigma-70 factor (ECF subfamily)